MSEELMQWKFNITVIVKGDETKKDTVRDAIKAQFESAKTAGNIVSASIEIIPSLLPEHLQI